MRSLGSQDLQRICKESPLRLLVPVLASVAVVTVLGETQPNGLARSVQSGIVSSAGECRVDSLAANADADGLSNACESSLAKDFAPELRIDTADCSWTGPATEMLAGGYFYAVHPLNPGRDSVRIVFLPAYFRDCGWRGFQQILHFGRGGAHAGDSEVIVVDVRRLQEDTWQTTGVFLSAHCFGRSDGRCRWFRGRDLEDFAWTAGRLSAPRVWVARDKHANYPNQRACESGHWRQEECGGGGREDRFPVRGMEQNLGTRTHPQFGTEGCVSSEQLPLPIAGTRPGTSECLWSTSRPFRGWQRDYAGSATPYGLVLRRIAGL